jgi:outer membrane protein assembly factor BamE (lipoprotein component of BamABCDE complex)
MRPALAYLAGLVVALAVVSSASGMIVLQRGMAGVAVGMTKAKVRATLGRPTKVLNAKNEFGKFTQFDYVSVTVLFQSGSRVTALRTRNSSERTSAGVGVGSRESDVRTKVPKVKCANEVGFHHCYVGIFKPGHVITDFLIRKGRVSLVVVGRVLD